MGLGFLVTAALPGSIRQERLAGALEQAFRRSVGDELLGSMLTFSPAEARLLVNAHPADEAIFFLWDQPDTLTCSARTNGAWPGYHAWLVDVVASVGDALGLRWAWTDEKGDIGDETGYHEHRDFGRLQHEMLAWLKALSSKLCQYEGTGFSLCLPLGFRCAKHSFAQSPLGFWPIDYFKRIAEAPDIDSMRRDGSRFFPWWNQSPDAECWKRRGLVLAWCEVPWSIPCSKEETSSCEQALACFQEARRLDPAIELPGELEELEALVKSAGNPDARDAVPDPSAIGFKRHEMAIALPGGWSIRLPGYYHAEQKEDGGLTFWFGPRTLHVTTYRAKSGRGQDELLASLMKDVEQDGVREEYRKEHLVGAACLRLHEKEHERYWMVQGAMVAPDSFAFFTICFDDENDRECAGRAWRSLHTPCPCSREA